MPYCDQCGNEVSVTDKRCSKCGNKLNYIPNSEDLSNGIDNIYTKIKRFLSPNPHHNIEFILSLIGILFIVISISLIMDNYGFQYSNLLQYIIILMFIDIIGVIVIRYYAKIGGIILLITTFLLFILGVTVGIGLVFIIIAVILAFIR